MTAGWLVYGSGLFEGAQLCSKVNTARERLMS
jgi:hypothetical protein